MVDDYFTLGTLRFNGAEAVNPGCRRILFTHGMVGMRIGLEFNAEWDEFPYRQAIFFACDLKLNAEIVDNTAVIPAEILARPYTKVYMGVCGYEWEPDPETEPRRIEIVSRINTISHKEMKTATDDTVETLMEEYSALQKEFESLGGTRKCMPSTWIAIGRVVPGVHPGELPDGITLCHQLTYDTMWAGSMFA